MGADLECCLLKVCIFCFISLKCLLQQDIRPGYAPVYLAQLEIFRAEVCEFWKGWYNLKWKSVAEQDARFSAIGRQRENSCARYVPHLLSYEHRRQRRKCIRELLKTHNCNSLVIFSLLTDDRAAQSLARVTEEPEVSGSIPHPARFLRGSWSYLLSFSLSSTAKEAVVSYWRTNGHLVLVNR